MIYSTQIRKAVSASRRPHFLPNIQDAGRPTNADLEENLRQLLQKQGHGRLGEIEVDVEDDVITISGVVATYYQLQLAQTIIMKNAVGRTLQNSIRVD